MSSTADSSGATLICAFEGWNDACQTATNVVRHLVSTYDAHEVRHIRNDDYYDYQVSRPMVCHISRKPRIVWPQTTFYDIPVPSGRRIYTQIAPEPNYRWMEYCQESLSIAEELGVTRIVVLGSMYAECPHTRPLPIEEIHIDLNGRMPGSTTPSTGTADAESAYDGPAGITTVLDILASEQGFETSALWASVPQYAGSEDCAQGTLQLLRSLSLLIGTGFDEGSLPRQAAQWKAQATMLMSCNDDLKSYVGHLEHEYDKQSQMQGLAEIGRPQAEQLVRETEEFLARQAGRPQ